MSLKYEPSAAALSWLALSQTIQSRAAMEGSLFTIFSEDMQTSMSQSQNQSQQMFDIASNEKWQTIVGGLASIGGALSCVGYEGVMGYKINSDLESACTETNETEVAAQLKDASKTTTPADLSTSMSEDEFSDNRKVELTGVNQPKEETSTDKSATLKKDDEERIKGAQNEASTRRYGITHHSQLLSQFFTGLGSVAQSKFINEKGKAQAAQAIAQGLSKALDTEVSQMASTLSSCDAAMNNSGQTLQTIVSVSAVRG